ncbi:MAG: Ig-like domain-containing protein [Candidatus Thermoplasmatota archaeon]|nr:Ig-like domain-containing protein [Candidatus Thermoplasmatota archaeon]
MKSILAIVIAFLFLMPVSGYVGNTNFEGNNMAAIEHDVMAEFNHQIEISPGEDYYIHFSPESGIDAKSTVPYAHNLSQKEKMAISRSPSWIQRDLAKQFEFIDEKYADLLLNVEKKYVDEIAFSIAHSPVGAIPPLEILFDNAYFIYENDRFLDYVEVVDIDNGNGYYSTIRYRVLEGGEEKEILCPPYKYYWFVVSPKATTENATYIYGKFWRDYLFYHNDMGYPLLMEKLSGIKYLWDCQSYRPPAHRMWKYSMENHPTAVEAINYWVGKNLPALATGDRPSQPNKVCHEHNGFCGEIQELSAAALRTALIPSVPINCLGEDHVWCEFWERGWHEFDEWWADGGGSIDNFGEYRYGWHKIMSALFAWKGDSSTYDVTDHYINEEDRGTVKVVVQDIFGNPVDGARVTVFGSWKANDFKDRMWNKVIDGLWSRLPDDVRKKWQENYTMIKEWYHERVPGLIPWVIPSIWNYTDVKGECTFHLGAGHSYFFALQKEEMLYFGPWGIGKSNAPHYMITIFPNDTRAVKITFVLPDGMLSFKKENVVQSPEEGDYEFDVAFDTSAYQIQRNIWDWEDGKEKVDYGKEEVSSAIKFFIVDKENFGRYKQGDAFDCYEYLCSNSGDLIFNASSTEWYLVFRNDAKRSTIVLNISASFKTNIGGDYICMTYPWSDVFDEPIFNIGDIVTLKGRATTDGYIQIAGQTFDVLGDWKVCWNTSYLRPGEYTIRTVCGSFEKRYNIRLVDSSPPVLSVNSPLDKSIIDGTVLVKGRAYDNVEIDKVELKIGEKCITLSENFSYEWNTSPGDYAMIIKATDWQGLETMKMIAVAVNESGNDWGPAINGVWYTPENPANESNVVIYADVTEGSPFSIKKVEVEVNGEIKEMYRYADNPVQPRHEEDPLKNESNMPAYGVELGQFSSGDVIKFRIRAYDNANNTALSEETIIRVT